MLQFLTDTFIRTVNISSAHWAGATMSNCFNYKKMEEFHWKIRQIDFEYAKATSSTDIHKWNL